MSKKKLKQGVFIYTPFNTIFYEILLSLYLD